MLIFSSSLTIASNLISTVNVRAQSNILTSFQPYELKYSVYISNI